MVKELDFNCRMGEDPYEIEIDVHSAAKHIGELFARHMESNPPHYMPPITSDSPSGRRDHDSSINDAEAQRSVYRMHIEILLNFAYLFSSKRTRSITRYSERLLEHMLIESSQEMGFSEILQLPHFYANFEEAFKFLEMLGLNVHASLRIKQLRSIQRRMLDCDTKQFACH
jgi:hypothetical protein